MITEVCVLLACAAAAAPRPQVNATIPVILEKDEGERRIVRGWPGHPDPGETFILKIDPKNGGSSRLVLLTAMHPTGKEN
jgi:hypothetical protein